MGDSGGPLVTLENSKYALIGVVSFAGYEAYLRRRRDNVTMFGGDVERLHVMTVNYDNHRLGLSSSHDGLAALLRSPRTVILYPGPEAADVTSLPPAAASEPPYNVLLLDGTWRQAKTMYTMSPALHGVRQVQVSGRLCSSYVVRTQPTNACLSTVEAAAACLQHLEQRPQLGPQLLQPLHALCRVQLSHGAVRHSSKQALIERGEYERQRGARTNRMFRQLGVVL
ncbi:tRNA-uridine aminocarboxypropyltransferase 2-like [Pollicipes pollicipes]|uniref:tRNA-uridine aminocarboxypropyltransferase 2-like n=1 Tax=Pollicipes pollicipes TaxID=41117 RepID=UPI0018850EFB|nr:tRNA-uridine aminocarboxypropyltransferase 2-like [Pollicipes pollicipes]